MAGKKVCFILGIMGRSGTNYLYALLKKHPAIISLSPMNESFLTYHSDLLVTYANNAYRALDPKWGVEDRFGPPDTLLRYLGNGIIQFLTQCDGVDEKNSLTSASSVHNQECFLLKSPSVVGVENFFSLFPGQPLILLVRDGRSVVESGMRSFGWDFEEASREWANAAARIRRIKEICNDTEKKYLLVKYEDLFSRPREELTRILAFLNLDLASYDFGAAENQAIIGSSEMKKNKEDKVHWTPVEKNRDFNPLERWDSWKKSRLERFNWIGGDALEYFGYNLVAGPEESHVSYILRNWFLDMIWQLRLLPSRISNLLRKSFNVIFRHGSK